MSIEHSEIVSVATRASNKSVGDEAIVAMPWIVGIHSQEWLCHWTFCCQRSNWRDDASRASCIDARAVFGLA
jgi:hypothetical protein